MKTPKCKYCSGEHYSINCFRVPRKPIQAKKPLPSYTKPLQRIRKPIKHKSSNERPVAVEALDRVFSQYIRLKDARDGIARCVTCGATAHWKLMQNGHFIGRRNMSVRWDEMNCHVQCQYCNENLSGNMKVYKIFMVTTYGQEKVDLLKQRSRQTSKLPISELERLTNYYAILVKNMLTP